MKIITWIPSRIVVNPNPGSDADGLAMCYVKRARCFALHTFKKKKKNQAWVFQGQWSRNGIVYTEYIQEGSNSPLNQN